MKKIKYFLINIYVKCSSAADIFLQQLQREHHIKKLDQSPVDHQNKNKTWTAEEKVYVSENSFHCGGQDAANGYNFIELNL